MWHLDIPSESELRFLATIKAPAVVSIYLPTTPISKDAAIDAIALRNLVDDAMAEVRQRSELPRGHDAQKDTMIASIGPFWDANETWLVLGVGVLLVAFPMALAPVFQTLYLPVAVMLIGLILRGVAFDFRVKAPLPYKAFWNRAFFVGSLMASASQGWMLGSYITGFDTGALGLAFSLGIALTLPAAYVLLGAGWLVMKTEGELQQHAVRWAKWLAPAHDLQPVLAWRAWERAGRPTTPGDSPIPDAQLAGLAPGDVLLRSLPGQAIELAAVYERLGLATRATPHTVTVAHTAAALANSAAPSRPIEALDLHVWALLTPVPSQDAWWQLEADGLLARFAAAEGPWSGLRLTWGPAGLVVRPLWPNPAVVSDAVARRAQVEALLAWLTTALTPGALLPPASHDTWSEAERWPLPRLTLPPWTAAAVPLQRRDAAWACLVELRDPSGASLALDVQLLESPPHSPAAARTDQRWLVHGPLPPSPPGGWAPLLRQLAAWWTACERGAGASLDPSAGGPTSAGQP